MQFNKLGGLMKGRRSGTWLTRSLPFVLWLFLGDTLARRAESGLDGPQLNIEPATLDFGRVHNANGPLRLSFRIANRGNQAIKIAGVRSGCGCTVPQLVKSVLSPRDQTAVQVEVNIAGRIGPFNTRVLVDVVGRVEPITVPVSGTIIQDLWLDGLVVSCFALDSSPTVATTFDVRTVDWPVVKFAPPVTGAGVSIQELSRSQVADETSIKFRVVIDAPADQAVVRQEVVLRPLDKRVKGLTIPIVCQRSSSQFGQAARTGAGDAKTEDVASKVWPKRVSLGVISRGEEYQLNLSGEPQIVRALGLAGVEGLPRGAIVELRPIDKSKPNMLRLSLRLEPSTPTGLMDGRIRLILNQA